MAVYGVDVHDGYQAGLSFGKLYQQGYRFATVKLTQGTGYVRDRADDWIRAAAAAGLITGAYHWLTEADGAAQCRWFHRHVVAAGGPDGMLMQLDAEDDGYGPQMRAWVSEWNRLTGSYPFLIYSSGWWWNDPNRPMRTVRGVDLTPWLWHARYLSADTDTVPDDPAAFAARIPASWWTPGYGGWTTASLLQFTSKGDAGGLANNVDLNVYRGSLDELRNSFTRGGGDMSRTDDIVNAIAWGTLKLPDGTPICPSQWQVANEIRFATILAGLKVQAGQLDKVLSLLAQDAGNDLTEERLTELRAAWILEGDRTRDALLIELKAERDALIASAEAAAREGAHAGAEEGSRGQVADALQDAADSARGDNPPAG